MQHQRQYWVDKLEKIARPILEPLSRGKLHETLPVDAVNSIRAATSHLEAFGRTMTGIAPWLGVQGLSGGEAAQQERMLGWARLALRNATDPQSPDRCDFLDQDFSRQPIVDAAFLAHGILRAYPAIWEGCDQETRRMAIAAFKQIRRKKPAYNNWLLFSAMVEALLLRAGEDFDEMRVDCALKIFDRHWYAGDGIYSDGERFRMDYYNSYVIQPMLLQLLDTVRGVDAEWDHIGERVLERATRYAGIQERMIAPDGSFPLIGRSICYRMGAFQHLADMALRQQLPQGMQPAAVRCALTSIIGRCTDHPANFDQQGYLTVGVCAEQPSLREEYITTGSLYLCTSAFLPLGLPPENAFWSDPDADWSGKSAWAGNNLSADHALD